MVVPRWTATRTQPIAVDDVTRYLAGVIDNEDAIGEIGGPEAMTYLDMLTVASEVATGRSTPVVPVPVLRRDCPRTGWHW